MKKLVQVFDPPAPHWVGDGFPVRTVFSPQHPGAALSPFLLLDYAGPADFAPSDRPRGVEEHPHRGFETVTIVYQGELVHRDSSGGGGRIGPGDVQWMTAASGLVHEEMHAPEFTARGGTLEMVQLWINLPAKDKMSPPGYQTLVASQIPTVSLDGGARTARVIAGQIGSTKGPAKTFTPIDLWDLQLAAGKPMTLPARDGHTTALLVLRGGIKVGDAGIGIAQLALFDRAGDGVDLTATDDARVLFLGGEPIDEPVYSQGPFVMNTAEEIRQAIADFRSGRMGTLA